MSKQEGTGIKQMMLIQWIILPLMIVFLVFNYLIGLLRNPEWGQVAATQEELKELTVKPGQKEELAAPYVWSGEGVVTLWFDDAWISQFTIGFPIMEANGFKGVLAVPTQLVGFEAYASWAQIKRLDYAGWEMASHTQTHSCEPEALTAEGIYRELGLSWVDMHEHGLTVQHFVAPCGAEGGIQTQEAKNHYLTQRLTDTGINPLPLPDPYHILANSVEAKTQVAEVEAWLNQAKQARGWLNIVFHQIDETGEEYSVTPKRFAEMIAAVKTSGLEVILPSQALMMVNKTQ